MIAMRSAADALAAATTANELGDGGAQQQMLQMT